MISSGSTVFVNSTIVVSGTARVNEADGASTAWVNDEVCFYFQKRMVNLCDMDMKHG